MPWLFTHAIRVILFTIRPILSIKTWHLWHLALAFIFCQHPTNFLLSISLQKAESLNENLDKVLVLQYICIEDSSPCTQEHYLGWYLDIFTSETFKFASLWLILAVSNWFCLHFQHTVHLAEETICKHEPSPECVQPNSTYTQVTYVRKYPITTVSRTIP